MSALPRITGRLAVVSCVLGLTLALGTTGCLIIPTPGIHTGYARTNVSVATPQQFQPGQTTREDTLLALGEPDAVAADESKLA